MTVSETTRVFAQRALWSIPAILMLFVGTARLAHAQDSLGGHIGFVLPLVTRADGQTTNISDNFAIGFPVGITVKNQGRLAFDLELVPFIQDAPRKVTLTVHPGILWALGRRYTVGMRAAFNVNSAEYGFTPLINKSWPIKGGEGTFFKAYFVEAVLPVRFDRPAGDPATDPVTFAMHFGLGF